MNQRAEIMADLLAQRELAVVGVSRGGKKFGNAIYTELTAKGYHMMAVHPQAPLPGVESYRSFRELPMVPGGVVVSVRPGETLKVVQQAHEAGIRRVWIQQGSATKEAIAFCRDHEMPLVSGQCILMYAEPVRSIHGVHRWVWRFLGLAPTLPARQG
jgi:uncharacterized protein